VDQSRAPVFVLCGARSGSTLLRFILDSHPRLACPPEVGPGRVCGALAGMTDALHGEAGQSRERDADPSSPAAVNPASAAFIREVISRQYGDYLGRRRKSRWCDKSLDNALFATLLGQVYPDAQFVCLYRQCMDVIASGLEASPWGLSSFGFARHAEGFPGNSVAAIGHYWLMTTGAIAQFEALNPDRCIRVRYEDLVSAPEDTANSVFAFLREQPVPGIGELCLRTGHESYGASDQKIWFTDRITASSVGRGERIPVAALPPPLREDIDKRLIELGYAPVGEQQDLPALTGAAGLSAPSTAMAETIAARLSECTQDKRAEVVQRWPGLAGTELEVGVGDTWREAAYFDWRFEPGHKEPVAGSPEARAARPRLRMLASVGTWQALLAGEANMGIELVAARVRLDPYEERDLLREPAVLGLCVLLGLSRVWSIPHGDAVPDADVLSPDRASTPVASPLAGPELSRPGLIGALLKTRTGKAKDGAAARARSSQ
jgi:Sulfotransferase family